MRHYFQMNFFPYHLRKENTLDLPPAHSTHHGIHSPLFEVVFFGINFLDKLRKASPLKNLRKD